MLKSNFKKNEIKHNPNCGKKNLWSLFLGKKTQLFYFN